MRRNTLIRSSLPRSYLLSLLLLVVSLMSAGCQTITREEQLAPGSVSEPTELMSAVLDEDSGRLQALIKSGARVNLVSPIGSALDLAARENNPEALLILLRAGADPDTGLRNGQPSPLHYMAQAGETNAVRALTVAGAELEYRSRGATPLALAIQNGHLSTAKALIRAGADVNAVYRNRSLLMVVVEQNSLLMAQMLVDSGVDVNYRNEAGESALTVAQEKGYVDLQMLLLQSGARG